MKIKRFENVWIMGLILSGAILLFLLMYDQKELHEEYETRLKDGFKIEMC